MQNKGNDENKSKSNVGLVVADSDGFRSDLILIVVDFDSDSIFIASIKNVRYDYF